MDISQLDKMIEHCRQQQVKQNNLSAFVTFKVPRKPTYKRVRLFVTRGPFGEVLSVSDTGTVAKFKADAVIEFLERERSIELSRRVAVAKKAINDATDTSN